MLSDGNSTLHLAAMLGKTESIKVLIRAGANATQVNIHGQTALDIAVSEGHGETIELVSILLEEGFEMLSAVESVYYLSNLKAYLHDMIFRIQFLL